jgi:hypothetical protein
MERWLSCRKHGLETLLKFEIGSKMLQKKKQWLPPSAGWALQQLTPVEGEWGYQGIAWMYMPECGTM